MINIALGSYSRQYGKWMSVQFNFKSSQPNRQKRQKKTKICGRQRQQINITRFTSKFRRSEANYATKIAQKANDHNESQINLSKHVDAEKTLGFLRPFSSLL